KTTLLKRSFKLTYIMPCVWDRAYKPILVLRNHGCSSLDCIAKLITQFVVIGLMKALPTKITVFVSWHVAQEIIAVRINTIAIYDLFWMDDVAKTFAHLFTFNGDKTVNKELLWQRQA